MSKNKRANRRAGSHRANQRTRSRKPAWWLALLVAILVVGGIAGLLLNKKEQPAAPANNNSSPAPAATTQPAPAQSASQPSGSANAQPELTTMEVAKAVMVTEELDFGPKVPTIAEALGQIERRYQPDDGQGRTFSILDAYGDPTPDGKLHISMHVSSEKPGLASLVFKRTGRVLWRARIQPTSQLPQEKKLTIFIDDGNGRSLTVDGSNNPASILEANAKERGVPIKTIWQDGQEREVTLIYSACGCPVKVMVRRAGDRTVRTKDTPVIFPDDPAAVALISKLMRW